jgi:outer membrane protein
MTEAQKLFEEGTGKVTQVDLAKLAYGSAELDRFALMAQMGEALSLEALKHTVGMGPGAPLRLADERLPPPPAEPLPPLAQLLQVASAERPEWDQLSHGKTAALSLEQAERLANAPVVFAGAQLRVDWAPRRTDIPNSLFYDPYNQVFGGVAVGLLFDLDPWKAKARGDAAEGIGTQVEGLRRFAESGIPLEVRKAHDDAVQAEKTVAIAERGSVAARRWMTFAGAAYLAGTGEAKDVLEGLAAYVQSRRTYLEALQGLHTARGYVQYAVGRTGVEGAAVPGGEKR